MIEAVVCEPGWDPRQDFHVSVALRLGPSEPRLHASEPEPRALTSDGLEPEAAAPQRAVDPARAAAAYLAQSQLMAATRRRSHELRVRA